uniref:Sulfatase domain-containing protein n=1 Tax=Heterorhabditis bacteriophora TaxID=37862 RepID=A0A1I7WGY5_HETBA
MLTSMDFAIAQVIEYLKTKKIYENTVIVFTSDVSDSFFSNINGINCWKKYFLLHFLSFFLFLLDSIMSRMVARQTLELLTIHCEVRRILCGKEERKLQLLFILQCLFRRTHLCLMLNSYLIFITQNHLGLIFKFNKTTIFSKNNRVVYSISDGLYTLLVLSQ